MKKIKKTATKFVMVIIMTSFVLMVMSSFTASFTAYGASSVVSENASNEQYSEISVNERHLIAQAGDTSSSSSSAASGSTSSDSGGAAGTQTDDKKEDTTKKELLIPVPDKSKYEELPQLSQTTPTGMLKEFINGLFKNFKYIIGSVAVLFIVVAAVKLIIAGDNEEVVSKQKKVFTYSIIALAIIGFADELVKVMSVACPEGDTECSKGGFLSSSSAIVQQTSIFNREVKIIITFIKYIIGSIAIVMLARNAIRFVALAGKEESVTLDKKNIAYTSFGLILIIIASTIIDKVLFVVDKTRYPTTGGVEPAIDPYRGVEEIAGFTNFVVSLVGPIAVLVLIAGALMYATAGGDEERMKKAKKMIMAAIVGMIIIFGAFAIVSTVILGKFSS